jgi:glyoxylase-like metal-dependent hydrolase (beta-lactamase superfamily II)
VPAHGVHRVHPGDPGAGTASVEHDYEPGFAVGAVVSEGARLSSAWIRAGWLRGEVRMNSGAGLQTIAAKCGGQAWSWYRPAACDDQRDDDPASCRAGLKVAEAAGILRTVDAPAVKIAPRVTAHHNPGHTPGHYVVSVSSDGQSVYLLGDVVHHPLQLNDRGISFLSETEPEHALRAREELFAALEGREVSIGMSHFPGLEFQRITTKNGSEWTSTW